MKERGRRPEICKWQGQVAPCRTGHTRTQQVGPLAVISSCHPDLVKPMCALFCVFLTPSLQSTCDWPPTCVWHPYPPFSTPCAATREALLKLTSDNLTPQFEALQSFICSARAKATLLQISVLSTQPELRPLLCSFSWLQSHGHLANLISGAFALPLFPRTFFSRCQSSREMSSLATGISYSQP